MSNGSEGIPERPMSKSVAVDCGICHETIGEQSKPGEGEQLFRKHLILAHPKEAAQLRNTEHAIARIPLPDGGTR